MIPKLPPPPSPPIFSPSSPTHQPFTDSAPDTHSPAPPSYVREEGCGGEEGEGGGGRGSFGIIVFSIFNVFNVFNFFNTFKLFHRL